MKNKDFDSIDKLAQDALENFEVEFDPMAWMDMQSKLSAESSIDKVAREKLKNHAVPFDERDWKRLEKQLDKNEHLYPAVWWIKSAEVGIMALLIFTIFNLSTNQTKVLPPNKTYDSTTTLTPSSSDTNQNNADKQSNDTYDINEKEVQPKTDENQIQAMLLTDDKNNTKDNSSYTPNTNDVYAAIAITAKKPNNKLSNSVVATSATNNNSNNHAATVVATTGDNGTEIPNQTGNSFSGEDGIVTNSIITTTGSSNNKHTSTLNSINLDEKDKVATAKKKNNTPETTRSNLLSTLEIQPLVSKGGLGLKLKTTDPLFELKKLRLELPYHSKTFVGGVISLNINFANSMGGTSLGYGAGFSIDSELSSKFALKSGFLVSYKKYDLIENYRLDKTTIDGNIYEIEKTKTTNLVVIEIPLDVQYSFFRNEKWRIYITAGVSANIIGSRSFSGSQKTSYQGLTVSTDINSNDYERGLFEGGVFTSNVFLAVGGGLGLERQLGDKVSLYILPTYRHAVTPVDADFMSSFNFNIGIKTSL